ncbi:hypothetical protein [Rhodovulum visakhapatnamense]|uniref:Tail protein n=1 Tax=Rhodovulum visakhapatnamense TaxID=364297 RepID=A0A4R8F3C7_9RHOB|nr:hypothetical protein [Rhodovulum visakhapatnamense]TDX19820.1 hypothetical protein EV657_1548 [Rhodovulum visakhapatnamense]
MAHRVICLAGALFIITAAPALAMPPVGAALAAAAGGWAAGLTATAIMGQAAMAFVLSGVQMALAKKPKAKTRDEITLNKIQPVTAGLILYGERTLGGTIVARSTTEAGGKPHRRYHSVMPLACHEIDGAVEIWLGETKVWTEAQYRQDAARGTGDPYHWGQIDSDFRGRIRLKVHTGAEDQAAEPRYVAAASEWTADHRGRGVAYVYFEADYDRDLFPTGAPQIRVRARGKRVYDPRDGQTRYSTNPALCLRDYALTPELFGGIGWREEDLDDAALLALANLAEEPVPLATGGTEDRYAFNGVLDTEAAPRENLDNLSTAWGGWWACERGRLTVGGGAWEEPELTITEDMLVAGIRVIARRPFEEQFNVVKAQFADATAEHVVTDLPVLASETYRAADHGERLVRDLGELPGETGHARGQRLMKLALLKGRRQRQVILPCSLAAWGVRLGDTVRVTLPRRGWQAKTFEVTGRAVTVGPGGVQVRLTCIETGPAIFDWRTSEETPKPAGGIPTLPSPTAKPQVSAPTMTEELYETRGGGGVKTRVRLAATTDNPFIDAWQFSWRPISAAEATVRGLTDTPEDLIDDMAPGTYVFGARGRNTRGMWSDWVYAGAAAVQGENAPPVAITNLAGQSAGGAVAMLRWDRHPSLDVRQGGWIEFRHAGVLTGATWRSSVVIGKAVSGGVTEATLPLKTGTYLARPHDAKGNPGPVSAVALRAASLVPMAEVARLDEAPGFAGTKAGCSAAGGVLSTDEGATYALYVFTGVMDLGVAGPVRLVSDVEILIEERRDLMFGPGTAAFWTPPDGLFWQGNTDAYGDLDTQVRVYDPATATWGPWQSFDAAEFDGRFFQVRAALSVESEAYALRVTRLSVAAFRAT